MEWLDTCPAMLLWSSLPQHMQWQQCWSCNLRSLPMSFTVTSKLSSSLSCCMCLPPSPPVVHLLCLQNLSVVPVHFLWIERFAVTDIYAQYAFWIPHLKPFVSGVWSHETGMRQMLSWGWHIYLWLNLWSDRCLTLILLFWEPLIVADLKRYTVVHLSDLCQGFAGNP
jgi:hypothetical protein